MTSQHSKRASVRLIRMAEVISRVGLSKATIYNLMSDGTFPRQRKLAANSVAWVDAEVDEWIAERIAA